MKDHKQSVGGAMKRRRRVYVALIFIASLIFAGLDVIHRLPHEPTGTEKDFLVQGYFKELLDIDDALIKKNMLKAPIMKQASPIPGIFSICVDQCYVSNNPKLKRYIANSDLASSATTGFVEYDVPIGVKVVRGKDGAVLGKILRFNEANDFSYDTYELNATDTFEGCIDAEAVLDTGKTVHVSLSYIGKIEGSPGRYWLASAELRHDALDSGWWGSWASMDNDYRRSQPR